MAKLERNSIRVTNFVIREDKDGNITISSLSVSGTNQDTNKPMTINDLPVEDMKLLGRDVIQIIKRNVRFSVMDQ